MGQFRYIGHGYGYVFNSAVKNINYNPIVLARLDNMHDKVIFS